MCRITSCWSCRLIDKLNSSPRFSKLSFIGWFGLLTANNQRVLDNKHKLLLYITSYMHSDVNQWLRKECWPSIWSWSKFSVAKSERLFLLECSILVRVLTQRAHVPCIRVCLACECESTGPCMLRNKLFWENHLSLIRPASSRRENMVYAWGVQNDAL